jgi:hypothetical protein
VISVIDSHSKNLPKGLAKELRIPIKKNPTGEVIDTGKVRGIAEGKEFDEWFTSFLGR